MQNRAVLRQTLPATSVLHPDRGMSIQYPIKEICMGTCSTTVLYREACDKDCNKGPVTKVCNHRGGWGNREQHLFRVTIQPSRCDLYIPPVSEKDVGPVLFVQ